MSPLVSLLARMGIDPAPLLSAFSLPATPDGPIETSLPNLRAFFDAAAQAAGDPLLGIHFASRLERGTFGVLEYLWRSAATVRDGLTRLAKYTPMASTHIAISYSDHQGIVSFEIPGHPLGLGRQGNEALAAAVVSQTRQLTGTPCRPERVWFQHAAPPEAIVAKLIAFFGTPRIDFCAKAGGCWMSFPAQVLDLALRTEDPALLGLLEQRADEILATLPPSSIASRVRQRLFDQLRQTNLRVTAQGLGLSERTLQRRLASQGTSYFALLESVREQVARLEIGTGMRPIGEVALLLGYSEPSQFVRAFKRWTGVAPGRFRAGARN